MPELQDVDIQLIEHRNQSTMSRLTLNEEALDTYTEMWIEAGGECPFIGPPIMLFYNGGRYYIARGWHRITSAIRAGRQTVPAEVRNGTIEEAKWYSAGSDHRHGVRKTIADRRTSVRLALEVRPEASNNEIARLCQCSTYLVESIRSAILEEALVQQEPAQEPATEQDQDQPVTEKAPVQAVGQRQPGRTTRAPVDNTQCEEIDQQIITILSSLTRKVDERHRRSPSIQYHDSILSSLTEILDDFRAWQRDTA